MKPQSNYSMRQGSVLQNYYTEEGESMALAG